MPRQAKGKRGQSPPAATTNFANQKAASQAATNSLNSLRRVDPSIVEILASATHATLYNFGADQEWERADVEGPLFIAARNAHPRVRLVVLNRLSMTNMVEDVDETFELEVVDRYLIFRRSDDETRIRGLWFHSLEEHARMGEILEKLVEEASQPPPPPPQTSPKSEPPDKLQGESQSDYMKRLAQLRAAKRRAEEQAEEDARRARAAERLARLDAQRRAAHPPARPPPVQQQEDDRWQRGARVPAPPVEREPLRDAGVPLERAATRDGRSFASMFSPPTEPNPDQLKVGDGYDRHPNREKPKLFDPKSGSYVDPSSRPPPAPKTRGRGLRVIDDSAAPKKEAPQVRLLARPADAKPAPGTVIQKKEEKKKLAELPKDLSNADAETVKRLKAERAAEKAARQPRTRGFLYKHENGDVVLADGQPSRRSKRGRGGRKRAEAAAAAAAKAEQERLAPGPPVRSSSAGSVGDRGRAPGPVSQQSPPEPARGLGVFAPNDAGGNLSYAPFGGFSTAPPPPERAAVSALGGAEFIPRTSSAGSFGGIGIVQDDAPPRHDGPSTLGGAEFVPGAGLVRPEASGEQQLSSSFDAAGAPEFVPGGAFGSGLLGAPQKPGQPQGSGLLWDR
mmetsp:Transcript_10357/g.27452  ORF Transcript_10357/g.27452 Transcript_10357/m.27452 type:complete len:622 (+) Transcript_10357:139-2004(+)